MRFPFRINHRPATPKEVEAHLLKGGRVRIVHQIGKNPDLYYWLGKDGLLRFSEKRHDRIGHESLFATRVHDFAIFHTPDEKWFLI